MGSILSPTSKDRQVIMKNSRAADLGSKAKNLLPLLLFVMVGMNASESVTFTFKIVTVLEKCIYRKGSQVQWTEDKESMIPLSISHPLPSFAGHLAPSFQSCYNRRACVCGMLQRATLSSHTTHAGLQGI